MVTEKAAATFKAMLTLIACASPEHAIASYRERAAANDAPPAAA